MCCCNKFCFCMSLRTGSLIFAWTSTVLLGLGTLALLIIDTVTIILLVDLKMPLDQSDLPFIMIYQTVIITSALLSCFGSGFVASVLLLIGIIQRKPILIKGYIIYGIISTLLIIIVFTIIECVRFTLPIERITKALGCCIYWSILYLHYLTYKDMISTTNGYVVVAPVEA